MTIGDSNPGSSGEATELTPPPPPPLLSSDFMSSVMARLAHQEEVQKTTNEQLAALVAALTAPAGPTNRSQPVCRHLFPPTPAEDRAVDESDPNGPPAVHPTPTTADPTTIREIAELKLSLQQMSSQFQRPISRFPQDLHHVYQASSNRFQPVEYGANKRPKPQGLHGKVQDDRIPSRRP